MVNALMVDPAHLSTNGGRDGCTRIYLVRHGQTLLNVEKRYRGTMEVPLNEQGTKDAALAAQALANVGLVAVYTSPLSRACEVAAAITEAAETPPYHELPDLLNLDYGEWHGLTKGECALRNPEAWRSYRETPEDAVCPGGEALAEAADRVVEALLYIGECHRGQSVAAVSHGVMVRLAALRARGHAIDDWEIPIEMCSATVFEVRGGVLSLAEDSDRVDGRTPAQVVSGQRRENAWAGARAR